MALSADEQRAFEELTATFAARQPREPRGESSQSLVGLVLVTLCLIMVACLTVSLWL